MPLPPGVRRLFRLPRRGARTIAADVDEELRFHLDLRAAELAARQGLDPAAARAEALRQFGDVEEARRYLERTDAGTESAARARELLGALWQDLRLAWRGVRARPGFAVAVVVTLALGIGANAAIFSAVDRLLFRLPPLLREPARTHRVYQALPLPNGEGEFFLEAPPFAQYEALTRATRAFSRTALYARLLLPVGAREGVRETPVGAVTASFFPFFDAPPALGRYFGPSEDAPPSGAPVVVLSDATWRTRYASRADVLGDTLRIGPTVYTIIGVAPRGFVGLWPDDPPAVYIPHAAGAAQVGSGRPEEPWWTTQNAGIGPMLALRRPDATEAAASAELNAAMGHLWDEWMGGTPLQSVRPRAMVGSLLAERGPAHTSIAAVAALVGGMALLVLLIAGANVANLLLARALRRRREVAVRLALGVSRRRLLAQLLVESVLLALLGGVAGLVVAQWGGVALRALLLPDAATAPLVTDARTLAFVGAAVLVVGLLTGLAPALQARRADVTRALRAGARDGGGHRSRARVALLVVQGALSALLLVGAGLFVRSVAHVREIPLGFDVDPVLAVEPRIVGAPLDSARAAALHARLLAAARRVPGVQGVALSSGIPFASGGGSALRVPGLDVAAFRRLPEIYMTHASPDYFAVVGTRLVRGRGFGPGDVAGAPRVVVVSRSLARALWPGRDALGQCVKPRGDAGPCATVVGIAEDIRNAALRDDPGLYYYVPAAQQPPRRIGTRVVVRTRGDATRYAETLRQALQREMPGASYVTVATFASVIGAETRSWRLGATAFVAFGALALALAAVGLYGVVAYDVEQRTHEVGVRVALGAERRAVVWMVVRRGMLLGALGIVLGGGAALVGAGRIAPLLFDVSPRDPLVYAVVAAAMLAVATAASLVPARRAARVDPTVALRSD